MAIEVNKQGPLRYAVLYRINEAVFYDKTRPPQIDPMPDDEPYTITSEDRIDLLSSRKYGGISSYGWIILLRNQLRDWPNDFVPGSLIYIPTLTGLKQRGII